MSYPASISILSLFPPLSAPRLRRGSEPRFVGSRIILGTVDAPYVPEDGRRDLARLREMLEARGPLRLLKPVRPLRPLSMARELTISITTRSPLLLHDLDLLAELDRDHVVNVDVLLPALDPDLVRRLEPHVQAPPAPLARLELVRRLTSEGIATRLLCRLLAPALRAVATSNTDEPGERHLHALFTAAGEAGAWDLVAAQAATDRLGHTIFNRLRLEYGFPRGTPGRG